MKYDRAIADKLKAELPSEILSHCSENLDKLKLLGENDKLALEGTGNVA